MISGVDLSADELKEAIVLGRINYARESRKRGGLWSSGCLLYEEYQIHINRLGGDVFLQAVDEHLAECEFCRGTRKLLLSEHDDAE